MTTIIVINFPNNPNETVIYTDAHPELPPVVYIDGSDMTPEQKKALLDARAAFIERVKDAIREKA
jgi:hypothetical protein